MKESPLKHIPNILTCIRILGSVLVFYWMINQSFWTGYSKMIFLILLLSTDWLDGYLARKYNWVSGFGKIMDPIADKILLNGIMIAMIFLPEIQLSWVLVALVISRELFITVWRIVLAKGGKIIPADSSGKIKTILQSILCIAGCIWVFGVRHLYWPEYSVVGKGLTLLFYGIVVITLFSGFMLIWKFYWPQKRS